MILRDATPTRVQFGLFEADLQTGELWKAGRRIKLQGQPFRVLTALLERPGEVVTREELQERLWGRDAAGDFDQSIGTAINKVRDALGDSADNPRFIETLSRRGYRFIAPVTTYRLAAIEELPRPDSTDAQSSSLVNVPQSSRQTEALLSSSFAPLPVQALPEVRASAAGEISRGTDGRRRTLWRAGYLAAGVAVLAGLTGYVAGTDRVRPMPRIERLTHTGRFAPPVQSMESLPASVTDGLRIFTTVIAGGRTLVAQVDVHTGAVRHFDMPSDIASPMLADLSPDGASLLLRSHLSPESEQPLWVVPTGGGSALRLSNIVAHDATWMPDGKSVLYAAGNEIYIEKPQEERPQLFAQLPGRAFWLRWSPDGELLRFTLLDPVDHTLSLWQIGRSGGEPHAVLPGWTQPPAQCCGTWTGDGRYFVFQSTNNGDSDLWRLSGKDTTGATRITNGPLSFVTPTTSRNGHRIYFLGIEAQSALLSFDSVRKVFVPEPDFLADANRIEYSRDLRWVIWTDQQGRLWRARADGSERIQVTPDSLEVFLARWSPDGTKLALMAREAGKAWQIYTVPPGGGTPLRLLAESHNEADPSWSADGLRIAFGRVNDVMGKEEGMRALQVLDLVTGKVTAVPHSEGLFSPRYSPDGRYLAAITIDQQRLMLLDLQTEVWTTVATTTVADPVWSSDGRSIVFHADRAPNQPIYRVTVPDAHLEQVANLDSFIGGATADYFFCGLTPDGRPIVRSRTGTGDVYSMDLEAAGGQAR